MPIELEQRASDREVAGSSLFTRAGATSSRLFAQLKRLVLMLLDFHQPRAEQERYVRGRTRLRAALLRPALLGFFGSVAIVLGASQPNSPFTWKYPGAWFFGDSTPPFVQGQLPPSGPWLFFGVVAVFGGMALMIAAWVDLVHVCSRVRGIPIKLLVPVFVAWALPLLFVAPLFSRDLYSYAAQGEMMSRGINPYLYGPGVLGSNPFVNQVDPLWQNVSSPYGPVFLSLAGLIVSGTGHNELASVEGLRLLALVGTVAFSFSVPSIARSFGRDGASAFVLVALNPLVLLHLVGGGHNDALMLGLMVPAYALARKGHPLLGALVCGLAAAVKVPALIGSVYIGWEWLGAGRPLKERARPVATAVLVSVSVLTVLSQWVGLGWGFIGGLSNPDTVRSWLDPATGVGLMLGKLVGVLGLGGHTHILLTLSRGLGLMAAAGISLVLLLRADRIGTLRALGLSCVAIVVLSPVVQPWYLTWGIVFLAPIVEGRTRRLLIMVSSVACFLGLPGGRVLLREIVQANPILVGVASLALVLAGVLIIAPRLRPARRAPALENETASV